MNYPFDGIRRRRPAVRAGEEVSIALSASDDFGVTGLELRYAVNGGAEQRVTLTDSLSRRSCSKSRCWMRLRKKSETVFRSIPISPQT